MWGFTAMPQQLYPMIDTPLEYIDINTGEDVVCVSNTPRNI